MATNFSLTDDARTAIATLCKKFFVQRLEMFGSAVNGNFNVESSDMDFLVAFDAASPGEHYERYFGLVEALEDLFERRVDLVESQAMRNPYFIQDVNKSKELLYAA